MSVKDLLNRLRRLYFLLLMLISTFAGFILIIFSPHMGEVARDVGISLLIAGTVGLGVELYNREHGEDVLTQLIKDAIQNLTAPKFLELENLIQHDSLRALGVRRIFLNRLQQHFTDYIQQAEPRSEIRLLGISMSGLASREAQDMLIDKVKNGCKIKWLLFDPASDMVDKRAEAENFEPNVFRRTVEIWSSAHQLFLQSLPTDLRGNIELRHYSETPCCFIVDNGRVVLVGFYLRSCSGEQVPHLELEVKDGGAYLHFRRHFDSLWAAATLKFLPFEDRRRASKPVAKERRQPVADVA